MRIRLASSLDALHSSYWFIPAVMSFIAILMSFVMVRIDQQNELIWFGNLGFVFLNQPNGARTLLSTVAGSMIGVAGTTFSITLAVLTLTSSQFGPRLLSTFMRDRGNQVVLGTFAATSLYCLLVLRTVRSASETAGPAFVPHLAVTVAIFLAVLSLAIFIYFIHHTADSIQAATILARISGDLERLIPHLYPKDATDDEKSRTRLPVAFPDAHKSTIVVSLKSGYLQAVDVVGLQTFAVKHRTLVQSLHQPGTFVVEGRPLARLWLEEEFTEKAVRNFHANFRLGSRRTPVQDLGFLFDQLTEVALRALSPGINDPITAMRCVDRISQGLRQLGLRQLLCPGAFLPYRRDEEGHLLVVLPEPDIEELVANSLGAIRRFSGDNLIVALHLLDTIGILLEVADHTSLQRALRREGRLVRETARPVLLKEDFERLSARYEEVIGDPQS